MSGIQSGSHRPKTGCQLDRRRGGALWGQVWRKERHRVVLRMLKDKSWGPEVIAGGWPGP